MASVVISDATKCAGCMLCMLCCSLRFEKVFNFSAARIKILRTVNHPTEFEITFTPECDGCGICAKYCPYGALTWQKKQRRH